MDDWQTCRPRPAPGGILSVELAMLADVHEAYTSALAALWKAADADWVSDSAARYQDALVEAVALVKQGGARLAEPEEALLAHRAALIAGAAPVAPSGW